MAFQRVFVDLQGAAGAPPREPIAYRLDVETEGLVARDDLLVDLEVIIAHRMPFVVDDDKARRSLKFAIALMDTLLMLLHETIA